jgi:Domain of unknown function DUF29
MDINETSLYQQDFYGWTQWQTQALAQKQLSELDWQNLQEEVQALGRQEYRELVSRLSVLLGHLLKWQYQPERRSRSWFLTIREQRRAINRALRETDLPLRIFPANCPYKFEDIITDSFLCDTNQDWEP